jgi:16S rRNA (cytosine967-C5)-methyltransferase
MTPSARVQAAIELLDAIIAAARGGGAAADTLIARYFAERRYAGSKDRRAVRELVYSVIRAVGEVPKTGRSAMLAQLTSAEERNTLFDGSPHGPVPFTEGEPVARTGFAPRWLVDQLTAAGLSRGDLAALIDRAPLDIRINTALTSVEAVAAEIEGSAPIAGLPNALRLPTGYEASALMGRAEVQDAGSQFVSLAAGAQPGMTVVDLCAGGGGKTLALAAAMANQGRILATDTNRDRLDKLIPRANRAGVTIAETQLLNPGHEAEALVDWQGKADLVVIDAPCSGTGTWRRNPEARWRLTAARLAKLTDTQRHLIDIGAALVKPGGALTYIVCSLLDVEGPDQIAAFLAARPDWRALVPKLPVGQQHGNGLRLMPSRDSTDGFFVARLIAP